MKPIRIGHITPSSNTWLEPLTYAMNRPFDGKVTHHFSRIRVTQLSLGASSEAQFLLEPMLAGARLLADAPLDALVWNGTSASWRGLEHDHMLADAVRNQIGLPFSTSTIAFYKTFEAFGWQRIGLAVPYTRDVTAGIAAEYARQGFTVTSSACLGLTANIDIGAAEPEAIRELIRQAAASKPDCVAVVCTNLNATQLIVEMEAELGIPIVDSIAITLREALELVGAWSPIPGWGKVLASP